MNSGVLMLIIFFFFIFSNIPIAVSLGLTSVIMLLLLDFPLSIFSSLFYASAGKYTLLAIPFFVLAGVIMDYAGISRRLIKFAQACVGHRRGGLAIVVVIVSCFFAAISGSGPATVAALGGVMIPAMVKGGYDKGMSAALQAASGGIGVIIPPSICFVVYGVLAEVSIGKMFAAGIFPGLLIGACYIVAAFWSIRSQGSFNEIPKAAGKEKWKAFFDAFWGMLTPVIILGGIYGGIFTPTEAAGVAVVYGLIVGIFIYREIKIKELWNLFVDSVVSSSVVMYIVACAGVFAWVLTTAHIATDASEAILSVSANKYVLLLLMNVIFAIAGCFIDANSAMYILVPILLPVIKIIGYDPIAFGVFMTANLAVGMVTPPVGVNLYVAGNIANITMKEISYKVIPFVIAGFIGVLIMTYIPQIIMFLPNLMGL